VHLYEPRHGDTNKPFQNKLRPEDKQSAQLPDIYEVRAGDEWHKGDRKIAAGDGRARDGDWWGPLVSVAYVVTSHRYPEQVLRLARTLRAGSPDAPLLIHHDDRQSQLDVAVLAGLGDVQLVQPPTAVAWGWASHLDMLLRCFAWALERVPFDWLTVLSGQDYPIRPLAEIERDLLDSPYDGYVEGIEVDPPRWTRGKLDEFSRRYFYRHRSIRNPGAVLRCAIAAARPALLVREMPWGVVLGRRCAAPFSPALPAGAARIGSRYPGAPSRSWRARRREGLS
jgi:hypothetical protein